MADNVAISAGAGTTIATDDIGTVQFQRIKLIHGIDGVNDGDVSTVNALPVNLPSVISTVNSTAVVLAASAVFTGTSEDVSNFAVIAVSVFTSHASATDGFSAQQSSDGTNWDVTDVFTVPVTTAGNGKTFSFQPAAKFFRMVYTNGGTLQTSFRLQTVYHRAPTKASSQRPSDAVSNENDFEQVSAFNSLFNGTTWDRMRGDTTNGLDVDVTRLPVDTTASGTITAISQSVAIALSGQSGVAIQITNTWVGTLQFEGTVDGTNWVTISGVVAGTSTPGTTTTTNGVVRLTPAGLAQVRITSTAWTSGTATISLRASAATGGTFLNQSLTAGTNQIGSVTPYKDMLRIADSSAASELTIATTAYTAGDQVGVMFQFAAAARASGGTGMLVGMQLTSAADIIGAYDVVLCRSNITLAADNAAFAISDADALNVIGLVQLAGAFDIGNNRIVQAFNLAIPYDCLAGTILYGALITRAGHTFFGAHTDLQLTAWVERN